MVSKVVLLPKAYIWLGNLPELWVTCNLPAHITGWDIWWSINLFIYLFLHEAAGREQMTRGCAIRV